MHVFMRSYFTRSLDKNEQKNIIVKLISIITSYEKICNENEYVDKIILHLKRIDEHLCVIKNVEYSRIKLLTTLGFLLKEKGIPVIEALPYFEKCLELNEKTKILSTYEKADILLALGEICVISNKNTEAFHYLEKSFVALPFARENAMSHAKNHTLIGIVQMKGNCFKEANDSFNRSLEILNSSETKFDTRLLKAKTYLSMGLNYCLYYINKPQMREAIQIMAGDIEQDAMVLFYPALGSDFQAKSYDLFGHLPSLSQLSVIYFLSQYTGQTYNCTDTVDDKYISPNLEFDMHVFSKTLLISARCDVLLSHQLEFAAKMQNFQNNCKQIILDGAIHCFMTYGREFEQHNTKILMEASALLK
jgi:tetratricopeptide (TPR) repeat protein